MHLHSSKPTAILHPNLRDQYLVSSFLDSYNYRAHDTQAWEYVEEIVQILKAAFPLLLLSLETMLDQMISRFKPSNDEDIYRHICLLLQDGSQVSSYNISVLVKTSSPCSALSRAHELNK